MTKKTFLDKLYAHPRALIIAIAIVSILFATQFPRMQIDNNNYNFIPKNDSARLINEKAAEIFGAETPILLGFERKYTSIFEKAFIEKLREVDATLSALPGVKRTVSILNTDHMEGEDGTMIARRLIDESYEGSDKEIENLKYKLRDWNDMYRGTLVSDDFKAAQFIVFLSVGNEDSGSPEALAVCRKIIEIEKNWDFRDSRIFITGAPVISEMVNQATAHDLTLLVPIVIVVVVGVLYLSFGRILGVILPLLTVVLSVDWAVGAMALFGIKLSILSTVMPVILVAVGSAYGIHVISHYFDEMSENKNTLSKDEHKEIIVAGMKRIIWPVFLAALTTFAGFVSFCFTSVIPIVQFGIFSSFGVIAAFVIAVALIPSILILAGPAIFKKPKHGDKAYNSLDAIIARTFMIISDHKRIVLLLLVVALSVATFLSRNVVIDNVLVEYFKNDKTVSDADKFIREKFSGAKELNLLIQSENENVVTRPDVLLAVDNFTNYFTENFSEVGKITSLSTLVKRLNQVLNSDALPSGLPEIKNVETVSNQSSSSNENLNALDDFGDLDDFSSLGDFSELETTSTKSNAVSENTVLPKDRISKLNFYDLIVYLDEVTKEGASASDIETTDLVRAIAKKINYNGLTYYEIPHEPAKYGKHSAEELQGLINDYMILLSSNLEGFVDNSLAPKVQKVTIQLKTLGQKDTDSIVAEMQKYIDENFPKDVNVQIAGSTLVEQSLNNLVVRSQFISLAISLAIVFTILAVYYQSIIAGFIGIIPLALSILLNFAFMTIFGIKVNIGTALVASFAIGIGIDYTIHYLDAYHRELIRATENSRNFLYKTFYGSGKAILFNAASVGAGFAVLIFSDFRILSDLGLLICLVMVSSSLASLTVLPVLLNVFHPHFIKKIFKRDGLNNE